MTWVFAFVLSCLCLQSRCQRELPTSDTVAAALAHYSSRVTTEANNPAVYTHLSMALRFSGKFDQAARVMEKGIALAPGYDSFEVRCVLGNLLRSRGHFGDALKHYQQAVTMQPFNQRGYQLIAMTHHVSGDFQSSLEASKSASRLSNLKDAEWHSSRLISFLNLLQLGQKKEALGIYRNVVGCSPPCFTETLTWSGFARQLLPESTSIAKPEQALAEKVASELEKSQRRRCDGNTRALILSMGETIFGLGANLHLAALALSFAMSENRVLLLSPKDTWWLASPDRCPDRNWECYFDAPTTCSLASLNISPSELKDAEAMIVGPGTRIILVNATTESFLRHAHPPGLIPIPYVQLGIFWWRSQLLRYLFKPKPFVRHHLLHIFKRKIGWPKDVPFFIENEKSPIKKDGIIGVHIRHGDKLQEEAIPISLIKYVDAATAVGSEHGWRKVFLATDSPSAEEEFVNLAEARGLDVILDSTEMKNPHLAFKLMEFTHRVNLTEYTLQAISNIVALASSHAIIATFSSNFGRVAAELQYAHAASEVVPPISLDVPWHADP